MPLRRLRDITVEADKVVIAILPELFECARVAIVQPEISLFGKEAFTKHIRSKASEIEHWFCAGCCFDVKVGRGRY